MLSIHHPVVIEQAAITYDATTNEPVQTWSTWRTAFAAAEAKRGREFFENGQRFAQTVTRFTFHAADVDGINERMRIAFGGKLFDIKSIEPDLSRNFHTTIEATETK